MIEPHAFEQSVKHWTSGTRPSWVNRSLVPLSIASMSKVMVVPVHSFLTP
jgi:hypothetical protein